MKITFLGTGTCHQQKDRSTTAIDCSGWGSHFLIDIGSGTMRRFREADIDPMTVEAIFITHKHPDHVSDFVPLIHLYLWNVPDARGRTLNVFGPRGIERTLWTLLQTLLPDDYDSLPFRLNIQEVENSAISFGKIKVESMAVEHTDSMAAVGYRFSHKGKSFAFTGDSGMCKALYKLSKGADLLISEANNPNDQTAPNHLTPAEAAAIGNKAGVEELVLTHISPHCGEDDIKAAATTFTGKLTEAEDLMEIRI